MENKTKANVIFLHFFCFCFAFALSLCVILLLTHSPTRLPPTIKLMLKVAAPSFHPASLSLPKLPITLPPRPLPCVPPLPPLPQVPDSHLSSLLRRLPPFTPSSSQPSPPPSHLLPPPSPLCFLTRYVSLVNFPLCSICPFPTSPTPFQQTHLLNGCSAYMKADLHTLSRAVSALLIGRPPAFCTAVEQQGACLTAQDGGLCFW